MAGNDNGLWPATCRGAGVSGDELAKRLAREGPEVVVVSLGGHVIGRGIVRLLAAAGDDDVLDTLVIPERTTRTVQLRTEGPGGLGYPSPADLLEALSMPCVPLPATVPLYRERSYPTRGAAWRRAMKGK